MSGQGKKQQRTGVKLLCAVFLCKLMQSMAEGQKLLGGEFGAYKAIFATCDLVYSLQ